MDLKNFSKPVIPLLDVKLFFIYSAKILICQIDLKKKSLTELKDLWRK
jgi:hypothetical protein